LDTIRINELEVWTRIGVPEEERRDEQRLLVSVEMRLSSKKMAQSDDVADGVDYKAVADCIVNLAKTPRKTIERFAEDCAAAVFSGFACPSVTVTVRKFPLPQAKSVEITIVRP
jgi:7,8-dihydroneopterin aldolase/epimerase/oxygenase